MQRRYDDIDIPCSTGHRSTRVQWLQRPAPRPARAGRTAFALAVLVVAVVGCDSATVETPEEVVAAAIERHGGSTFDRVSIRWEFRGTPFGLDRDGGRYRYHRLFLDEPDMTLYQVMENDGTWSELNGARQELDTLTRNVVESEINSTVYLGFLTFRLDDESVRLADLATADLEGRTYRKIEATFAEEGGGP